MMNAFTVERLGFSYIPAVPLIRDVSFDVERREFLSIVGPNGSGKTTLLKLLDRIYVPHTGRILLNDKNLVSFSRPELARRIALVPQDTSVEFPFTALDVVLMGRAPHTRGRAFESAHDRAIAERAMSLTDTTHLAHQSITTLSGGERQRVFIARALAQEPEIILLDEPNAHLDIAHQIEVFALMKGLQAEAGLTVVSVSHDLNLASAFSDRVAVLLCGGLVAIGAPAEVLTEERIRETFRAEVLVDTNPATNRPRVTLKGSGQRDWSVRTSARAEE